MNRLAIALVASAAALAASSVRADTHVRVGVSIGRPVYSHPVPVVVHARPPAVVYAAPPAVVYAPLPAVMVAPRGYWKEVHVKTWVPERWVVRPNRWGRAERYCEPGHYTYHTDRVWADGYDAHGHDRHHHSYSYHRR